MELTRRAALRSIGGTVALGAFAGCLAEPEGSDGPTQTGYAAFFALQDWTEQIAGGEYRIESPIDAGEVGHGWQADSTTMADIAETDVFVYLDTPEFRWAQDVAADLEAEADVALVDGMDGLQDELLPWDGHDDDHDDDDHDDHDDHDDGDHGHDHDDDDSHDDHDDDDHDDEHDHGEYDPHVWVDPVLAKDVVNTITDGLSAVYPGDADTFEENADAYRSELARVDEAFEDLVADAAFETGVLAGHDSFQYVEHRYGFDLHTPTGVSPDETAREGQIADTIAFVDENGIDTILYDAFDAPEGDIPPLAKAIVDDSTASDAQPVSPAEGTFRSWLDDGWGWIEQMEELNLPAFRKALGAE